MSRVEHVQRAKNMSGETAPCELVIRAFDARFFAPLLRVSVMLSICTCFGCGKYVTVEGRVTIDGQPADAATVVFVPIDDSEGRKMAQTFTDPQGRFALYTVKRSGALPGKYKVAITRKVIPPGVAPPKDQSMAEAMRVNSRKVESLPRQYTTQDTTPLIIEVPPQGTKDLLIELNSQPK